MRLTRIHGDEHTESIIQRNHLSFEVKDFGSAHDGLLNAQDLLGNYGQHFNVDAVEFIKACPGSLLGQTREESIQSERRS